MKHLAVACLAVSSLLAAPALAATHRAIAVTGDPVPNAPPGATFDPGFGVPAIDEQGRVAFVAGWDGQPGVFGPGADGTLRPFGRVGDPVPGMLDATYAFFSDPLLASGHMVNLVDLSVPCLSFCDDALLESAGDAPSPIWREDAGTRGEPLGNLNVNGVGDVLFPARDIFASREEIWVRTAEGDLRMLLRQLQPVPGGPPDAIWSETNGWPLSINAVREISVFGGLVVEAGDPQLDNRVLLRGDVAAGLSLFLREGDAAFDSVPGAVLGEFVPLPITDGGHLIVWSQLVHGPGGVGPTDDAVIVRLDRDGTDHLLARKGGSAAGIPGAILADLPPASASNARGDLLFEAPLEIGPGGVTPDDAYAVFAPGADGSPVPIARTGMALPGLEANARVYGVGGPLLNDRRDVVFVASVEVDLGPNEFGDPVFDYSDALYARTVGGRYDLLLRTGRPFEVRPGDVRTVAQYQHWYLGLAPGRQSINDAGQLAVLLSFTDATYAVVVFSIDPIACSDGADGDGDGAADFPDDPGCAYPAAATESPACDDGADNDGDGAADFGADPDCAAAWDPNESTASCGLGFEIAFVLPPLLALRRRRAAVR